MPQYLAPGVYVEEIPGPRTIQGVSTSVAAFIGPCRFGPTSGRPELLTSYLDFVSIYGDAADLNLDSGSTPNYLALGAKGFFDEGGSSLYVVRTFAYSNPGDPGGGPCRGGPARPRRHSLGSGDPVGGSGLTLRARFPGEAGRMRVTFTLKAGGNALVPPPRGPNLTRVHEFDAVWAVDNDSLPAGSVQVVGRDAVTGEWYLAGEAGRTRAHRRVGGLPADGAGRGAAPVRRLPRPTDLRAQDRRRRVRLRSASHRYRSLDRTDCAAADPAPGTHRAARTGGRRRPRARGQQRRGRAPGALAAAIFGEAALETAPSSTTPLEERSGSSPSTLVGDGDGPSFADYDGNVSFNDYANDGNWRP